MNEQNPNAQAEAEAQAAAQAQAAAAAAAQAQAEAEAQAAAAAAAAAKKEVKQVKARVLQDCEHGKTNALVTLPEPVAKAAEKAGLIDTDKAAVAYATSLLSQE